MEGLTILYTYTYSPGEVEFTFCIYMFIAFMVLAIGSLRCGDKRQSLISSIAALIFLIACIFAFYIKCNSRERYEIIIDESIDFSEFSEKYKTIDIRGKIYTIEERTN